jgi:Ankyrin repeats (many copies)/HEAT repeats/PBS lyase HEAT-like repeat
MNLKCRLGFHEGTGCTCSKCGKTRNEEHDWKARKYGWEGQWCEKCAKCYKENNAHIWNGCKCARCSDTRDEGHDWIGCKCARCNNARDEGHEWNGCKCVKCNKTRDDEHDWSRDCTQCRKCARKRDSGHIWGENLGPCVSCGALNPVRSLICVIADPNQADYKKNEETAKDLRSVLTDQVLTEVIGLLTSDSCRVRSHAATALRIIGDKRAVVHLVEFLRKPYADESISYYSFPGGGRSSAIGALKELVGKEAVPALIEALEDQSWGVREEAAKELCELEDVRSVEALEKLMLPVRAVSGESGEPRARTWAQRALQSLIGDKVLEWCKSRTETHAWVGCKCSTCGTIVHRWQHGKCSGCGMIRRIAGFTDLHRAICKNVDLDEIRNLCLNGLVNVGDEEGFTPLMKASGDEGNLEIVRVLVELGADINAESRCGTSPVSMAALHGKQNVVEYLKQHGAKGGFAVRTRSSSGESVKYH